jgi:small subunit ribosomal protein S16
VAPGGRHIEVLGSYDPHRKYGVFKAERIKYWMGKGAQVSDSVWNLLIKNKVIEGAKRAVKTKKKPANTEAASDKPEEKKEKEEKGDEGEKNGKGGKKENKDKMKAEEKPIEASIEASKEDTKKAKTEDKKEEAKKE